MVLDFTGWRRSGRAGGYGWGGRCEGKERESRSLPRLGRGLRRLRLLPFAAAGRAFHNNNEVSEPRKVEQSRAFKDALAKTSGKHALFL